MTENEPQSFTPEELAHAENIMGEIHQNPDLRSEIDNFSQYTAKDAARVIRKLNDMS